MQNSTPRWRQPAPRRSRSMRRPLAYCTALIDSRRVRGPQAASRSSSGSTPPRPIWMTSTPRGFSASQTTRLDGNSWSLITTWSPGRQSRPKATKDSASEVFFTSATSSVESALSRRARRSRRRFSICIHCG
ncbi:hypothetical protein D3C76_1193850 [compost metagenome]